MAPGDGRTPFIHGWGGKFAAPEAREIPAPEGSDGAAWLAGSGGEGGGREVACGVWSKGGYQPVSPELASSVTRPSLGDVFPPKSPRVGGRVAS